LTSSCSADGNGGSFSLALSTMFPALGLHLSQKLWISSRRW